MCKRATPTLSEEFFHDVCTPLLADSEAPGRIADISSFDCHLGKTKGENPVISADYHSHYLSMISS